MTLIDAIKSGRPFRLPGMGVWYEVTHEESDCESSMVMLRMTDPPFNARELLYTELLAETWELQEPTVTITRSQFWEAAHEIWDMPHNHDRHEGLKRLARKLGLEGE